MTEEQIKLTIFPYTHNPELQIIENVYNPYLENIIGKKEAKRQGLIYDIHMLVEVPKIFGLIKKGKTNIKQAWIKFHKTGEIKELPPHMIRVLIRDLNDKGDQDK